MILNRIIQKEIETYFNDIPVTAIIGARQVGKSTLAKQLLRKKKNVVYLDMEKRTDAQMLKVPEEFFSMNKSKIICIDEIQLVPDIFREMRSFIDANKDTKFVVLGSYSPELLRQSSETLAGRIFLNTFSG